MVKLSEQDKEAIASAITEAEKSTSAEIVLVISDISDAYQSYVLLVGLVFGSLLAIILLLANPLITFLHLLLLQSAIIAMFYFIPFLRRLCIYFVPKSIMRHRASHRAYAEYITVSQNIPATVPILLLYVSLAEHYAHILTSRNVREAIAKEKLDSTIKDFTNTIRQMELRETCIETIKHITKQLSCHFPAENMKNHISNEVITPLSPAT